MKIVQCDYFPNEDRAKAWYTVHWSLNLTVERLEAELAARGLHPEVIYKDKGGTYWVPIKVDTVS